MTEILIYGLAKGETNDYMEQLLATKCRNQADIDKVLSVATEHGFHSFRIATFNGEMPNFAKTLAI